MSTQVCVTLDRARYPQAEVPPLRGRSDWSMTRPAGSVTAPLGVSGL